MINKTIVKAKTWISASLFLLVLQGASSYAAPTPGFNYKIPDSIMTPNKVETSIGTLNFYDGLPSKATSEKVFDYIDTARGVEVFLSAIPIASIEAMRLANVKMGVTSSNNVLIFDELMDSPPLFLTGNTDTVYASGILDLKKDGPTVIEIPKGSGPGTVNDAFFRFVTDAGSVGPDRGKGGTYLILPPDYKGDLKYKEGSEAVKMKINGKMKTVFVSKSTSYSNWIILRGFLVDGKPDAASKMFRKGLKIYSLSKANNPPKMNFINGSGKFFNSIHANDFHFYKELNDVLQREPVSMIDHELRGMMSSIGLQKGKKFTPDARMKKLLTDAMKIGNATARSLYFNPRMAQAYKWKGKQWKAAFVGGDYKWLIDGGKGGRNLDARTYFFYIATVNTPAMVMEFIGKGSQYALLDKDKEARYLYGDKNYKLNIPANVPAKDFWSIVVYDPQTRSELQTGQKFPSKNNKKSNLVKNADGSVDLYFGAKPPKGKEANWIQTVPGKGWFLILRLYGPLKPWFENEWKPGEIELLQ
ncbi:protein of unknown function DUF882 [hydrothermal vent metagenome]|uniref:DUF1254 domain-containing protein n=1 Tax=hydrothermal vent metagenome TaxID=652676 RepID=A0A3B0XSJ2_9ZZZZ